MSGETDPAEDIRTIVYDFGLPEFEGSVPRPTSRSLVFSLTAFYLTVMLFTGSYTSLFNLQSSLHFQTGVGAASLIAIYASSLLCYLFLSSILIDWLGLTRTISATLTAMVLFFAAHFYPVWYTLIPGSLVAGAAGATLWTCIPTYLSQVADVWRVIFKSELELTLSRLFSLLFGLIQASVLLGSATTYYVLRPEETDNHSSGQTRNLSCGADFCGSSSEETTQTLRAAPEDYRVYMLCGIFGGCLLVASVISATCVINFNPMKIKRGERYRIRTLKDVEGDSETEDEKVCSPGSPFVLHIKETWAQARRVEFLLLVLLIFYQGLEMSFVSGEFTKSYVSCSMGVHYVSWVVCCYSALYMVGSFVLQGPVIQCLGRPLLLTSAAVVGLANQTLLLLWKPPPPSHRDAFANQHILLFLASGIFGVTGSALHPQLKALYGLLLCEEKARAFAVMGVVDAMGGLVGFSISGILCQRPKIYLLMTVLVLGVAAYLLLEWKIRKHKRKNSTLKGNRCLLAPIRKLCT